MTRYTKNESARCHDYSGCCAYQHRHRPADHIEATGPGRDIRYDYDYEDLYKRARYTTQELTYQ